MFQLVAASLHRLGKLSNQQLLVSLKLTHLPRTVYFTRDPDSVHQVFEGIDAILRNCGILYTTHLILIILYLSKQAHEAAKHLKSP